MNKNSDAFRSFHTLFVPLTLCRTQSTLRAAAAFFPYAIMPRTIAGAHDLYPVDKSLPQIAGGYS